MRNSKKYQKTTFAINVIEERNKMGLTGIQFAEFVGMPYSTLADIESGISGGSKKNREKIAKALNTTVDELNTPKSLRAIANEKSDLIVEIISRLPSLNESQLNAVLVLVNNALEMTATGSGRVSKVANEK